LSLWCSQGITQEVISSFEEKNISVLNEELRRLQSKINHQSFTDTTVLEGQYPATDDTVLIGNGVIYQSKTIPNCTTGALNYTQATNALSCNAYIDIAPYLAGDHSISFNDGEQTTAGRSVWYKAKYSTLNWRAGTLRISFDAGYSGDDGGQARIYRNGVAVGTLRTLAGGYTTYTEDIAGWSIGDTVEIWYYLNAGGGGGDAVLAKNLRIYVLEEVTPNL